MALSSENLQESEEEVGKRKTAWRPMEYFRPWLWNTYDPGLWNHFGPNYGILSALDSDAS